MFIKININIFKGCIPKSSRKEDDIYRRSAFRNRTGNETIKCYKKKSCFNSKNQIITNKNFSLLKIISFRKKNNYNFLKKKKIP